MKKCQITSGGGRFLTHTVLISWPFHNIGSTRMAIEHSQWLARWLSVLCQISCVTLQSTRQPLHDS